MLRLNPLLLLLWFAASTAHEEEFGANVVPVSHIRRLKQTADDNEERSAQNVSKKGTDKPPLKGSNGGEESGKPKKEPTSSEPKTGGEGSIKPIKEPKDPKSSGPKTGGEGSIKPITVPKDPKSPEPKTGGEGSIKPKKDPKPKTGGTSKPKKDPKSSDPKTGGEGSSKPKEEPKDPKSSEPKTGGEGSSKPKKDPKTPKSTEPKTGGEGSKPKKEPKNTEPKTPPGSKPSALPPTPAVTGDPHFAMWNGKKFDFHGGCDLVLLQDPDFNHGQGLYIHIRTKIERWWSYVESAVVQIGDDTLEVMGGVDNRRHFVNGKEGEYLLNSKLMSFTIGGYPVRYRRLNPHQFQFKIFLENDQNIVLKAVKDFLRVDVENATPESFGKSVGLMGSFDGDVMFARDGVTILDDPVAFGKEWQVHHTEPMLFHDVEGVRHPEQCAMPDMSMQEGRRRLQGSIDREQAELACAKVSPNNMKDCVFDVMATNDVEMAGAF